jgi:hypothetical protein
LEAYFVHKKLGSSILLDDKLKAAWLFGAQEISRLSNQNEENLCASRLEKNSYCGILI